MLNCFDSDPRTILISETYVVCSARRHRNNEWMPKWSSLSIEQKPTSSEKRKEATLSSPHGKCKGWEENSNVGGVRKSWEENGKGK